ncbi:MAG: NAD-dependent epimerase/dehydratase family protein [Chitinophagaceae bacterium]|nr:MAG: NAD-dependent epimerase/dehydratase family protein [Chitinophagaceae bacterium]
MSGKTAAILGATGMIGQYLLEQLLNDPYFNTIRILVRRPYANDHPKLEVKLVDFKDSESFKLGLEGVDTIFCAIGTTQKNVGGDRKLYYEIDHDIPVNAARYGKENGVKTFVMVSSVGANPGSRTFYLQLKGKTEASVIAEGLSSVHIMQPSQLLGQRKEYRMAERIMAPIMKFLSVFLAGSLKKFKAIRGMDVARAMISVAKREQKGVFRYTYKGIMENAV